MQYFRNKLLSSNALQDIHIQIRTPWSTAQSFSWNKFETQNTQNMMLFRLNQPNEPVLYIEFEFGRFSPWARPSFSKFRGLFLGKSFARFARGKLSFGIYLYISEAVANAALPPATSRMLVVVLALPSDYPVICNLRSSRTVAASSRTHSTALCHIRLKRKCCSAHVFEGIGMWPFCHWFSRKVYCFAMLCVLKYIIPWKASAREPICSNDAFKVNYLSYVGNNVCRESYLLFA